MSYYYKNYNDQWRFRIFSFNISTKKRKWSIESWSKGNYTGEGAQRISYHGSFTMTFERRQDAKDHIEGSYGGIRSLGKIESVYEGWQESTPQRKRP
ncbi:hypothetical protein LCGC14_1018510 [marine sediment metagenome]|uniref:Uncharacterized protein n=1 Tax=marine sediment metagenome TaxID=412755 RepID=A0A0F9N2M6_9ZZZZ